MTKQRRPAEPTELSPATRWHDGEELRWAARHWATRIGVKLVRVQLRPMTSKWASISTAGRLTLNTDLLQVPKDLGEFVIVHELVHLLAPNHGKVFKSFLHAYLPDWQQRERQLRLQAGILGNAGVGDRKPPRTRQARQNQRGARRQTDDVEEDPPRMPIRLAAVRSRRTGQVRDAAPSPRPAASSTGGWRAASPTFLVVDDDPGIRMMLSEMLTLEGYPVQTAEHGGPALDILRTSTVGMVVLLGLMMPYVNGEMVLEAVAADKTQASRHIFVIVTGSRQWATTGRVAALRKQLDVPFVPKPFTVDQLIEAVDEAVQRWTARNRQAQK